MPALVTSLLAVTAVWIAVLGQSELAQLRQYQNRMSQVEVLPPKSAPPQTQESIETALLMFSIDVPETVEGPFFDAQLDDRGLTTGGLLLPQKRVTIGPAAFTSWAVLGSTLAHEIEVHVEQSFLKVVAQDQLAQWYYDGRRIVGRWLPALAPSSQELFENDGTWKAERDAYMYELKNARRFGLSEEEVASIWRVMDYFYPTRNAGSSEPHLSASSKHETDRGHVDEKL
jgi:hypothetical protein